MDVKVRVPAAEKLVDYVFTGIASVARTQLAPWYAGREAEARIVKAKSEAERQRILAEGKARQIEIEANALALAQSVLIPSGADTYGRLDLSESIRQRIQFQNERHRANMGSVVAEARSTLEGVEVDDHEPDLSWSTRFFDEAQHISAEELQALWGQVLAREVRQPRSTSIKTLAVLKDLDKNCAAVFSTLCSMCVSICLDGHHIMDARVPSLGGNAGNNALREFGLSFGELNLLNEYGLIISDYNSWYDFRQCIGLATGGINPMIIRIPFQFQGRSWVLTPMADHDLGTEFRLSGVALTRAGQELSRVVKLEKADAYATNLRGYFESNGLNITEVGNNNPQTFRA